MQETVTAIIVAAGQGIRFGSPGKSFSALAGRPMVCWSLDAFSESGSVGEIILVAGSHTEAAARSLMSSGHWPKLRQVALGGERRQDSVLRGVQAASKSYRLVAIHDAARPLITAEDIERCVKVASGSGAAILATPVVDTLKMSRGDGKQQIERTVPREGLWAAQTPQIFDRMLLLQAFEQCKREDWQVTDDASMLERMGKPVSIVQSDSMNIKVTTPSDALLAETMLEARNQIDRPRTQEIRSGIGYDVHRFAENRPLVLGGVTIPFDLGLEGHSDADVVLHAITDALLGAAALGDIGAHFPPSDPQWRNADSVIFLQGASVLLKNAGYAIVNIDATILAEEPRLLPYVANMRERIAVALAISPDAISIKATTNEKMGFVGRQEGIATLATAMIARTTP